MIFFYFDRKKMPSSNGATGLKQYENFQNKFYQCKVSYNTFCIASGLFHDKRHVSFAGIVFEGSGPPYRAADLALQKLLVALIRFLCFANSDERRSVGIQADPSWLRWLVGGVAMRL